LGLGIPLFRISLNPALAHGEYRILFKGLEAGRGRLELGWYTAAKPDMMNIPENIRQAAKAASSMLIRHADEIVQRRAPELLGRDEVEAILDAAAEKYPVVTGEVKSLLPLGIIREILQGLVSEQVSIRHIAVILETLADWGGYGPAPSEVIIEQIRQSLKRQICLESADRGLTLKVLTLEPKLENDLADRPAGPCNHSMGEGWENIISSAVRGMEERGYPPVILCSPRARSSVKEATRRTLPTLAVLSYLEIPPDINVEPLGEIRLRK
jgi:flagellar biosynthesis protein FlhA